MLFVCCSVLATLTLDGDLRYVPSMKRPYRHRIGELIYVGTVNEAGDFVPDPKRPPRAVNAVEISNRSWRLRQGHPDEAVYEYRHGRVIPGHLVKEEFIPEVGGVILDFKANLGNFRIRRVYNQPGTVVKKAVYEHMKATGQLKEGD